MNEAEKNLQLLQQRINNTLIKLQSVHSMESEASISICNDAISASDLSNELADLFDASSHQKKVLDIEFKAEIKAHIDSNEKRIRFKEYRATNVLYRNGTRIKIFTPYYIIKGVGKSKNKGLFPALSLLGIYRATSKGMSSYIAKLCSALISYDEVKELLKTQGITIGVKTIIDISKQISKQARLGQKAQEYMMSFGTSNTIVVSMDGGRVRLRQKKRGPKTKKKRNRFKGQWREVKLFVVYIVDDEGNKMKYQLPIIDGMIGSPDCVFALLKKYLIDLDLSAFKNIVFIADGAPWIWKRAKAMLESLGLPNIKIHEILDCFHAMEHLNKLGKAIHKKPKQLTKWLKKCEELLHHGKVDEFIQKIKDDIKKFRGKKVRVEREYFITNRLRLNYKLCKDEGLPLGSGAIESSIRRVVNLRMKGNSIFWKEESANDMLFLRSYYKAGRWGDLENMAYIGGLQMAA